MQRHCSQFSVTSASNFRHRWVWPGMPAVQGIEDPDHLSLVRHLHNRRSRPKEGPPKKMLSILNTKTVRNGLLTVAGIAIATAAQAQTPSVTPYGVVNSASYRSSFSPSLAPGSLFTIFGSNLSSTTVAADSSPVPTQLPGSPTRVLLGDTPAPLLTVSPNLINAQVPFGLGGSSVNLIVENENGSSVPVRVNLVAQDPGIFTVLGEHDPPLPGDVLDIRATGLGSDSPTLPD